MAQLEDNEPKMTKTGAVGWYSPLDSAILLPAKVTLAKSNGTVDLEAVEMDDKLPLREAIDIAVYPDVDRDRKKRYFVEDAKRGKDPISLAKYFGDEEKVTGESTTPPPKK